MQEEARPLRTPVGQLSAAEMRPQSEHDVNPPWDWCNSAEYEGWQDGIAPPPRIDASASLSARGDPPPYSAQHPSQRPHSPRLSLARILRLIVTAGSRSVRNSREAQRAAVRVAG
ncbi:hypothetical protein T484DRAFT_1741659 [Baffinella frigidus]|nr:hypothetical protein T484DRAFT_1741659 [Cryptophyta sp. CCMP2293]